MVEAAAKEGRTLAVAAALVLLPILIRSRIILTRSRTDDGTTFRGKKLHKSEFGYIGTYLYIARPAAGVPFPPFDALPPPILQNTGLKLGEGPKLGDGKVKFDAFD